MTKVIFVRHGETLWNRSGRYQGHSDIPLSEKGIKQAEWVAERLAGEKISAVYSSDLLRAVDTAKIIGSKHSLQPIFLPEFREVNFGLWEGLTYEVIMEKWPEILTNIYDKPGVDVIPEGESFYDLQKRTSLGLLTCLASHPDETIVLVSHGGTMRVMLCDALGLPIEKIWSLRQDSTAINIIEYYETGNIVSLVNDTCHIK